MKAGYFAASMISDAAGNVNFGTAVVDEFQFRFNILTVRVVATFVRSHGRQTVGLPWPSGDGMAKPVEIVL